MKKSTLKHLLLRLWWSEKGVAAVEFALIVPVLLVLYFGSVDVSQGISADRKLASVAATMGDLVAQTSAKLPVSVLEDYFSASQTIMRPFDGNQTSMLVTIAYVDADGNARVTQSRGRNGAPGHSQHSNYTLPTEIRDLARESYVVISEAWHVYHPLIGYVLTADITLYKQFFYIPRFAGQIEFVQG